MQYSPTIFAKAFCEVLLKTPESQYNELCNNFTSVLKKHGAIKDSNKIFNEIKKNIASKENISIIKIETARELSKPLIDKVKNSFNKNSDVTFKINKKLIAGIKITINDELSIDSSLQNRLKCLK